MKEIKEGSASIIYVVYQECGVQNKIVTCGQHRYGRRGPKPCDINTRTALGAIVNGIGLTHINSFFSTLNVPTLNKSAYKKREREAGQAIEEVASNSCEMVLKDEIRAAENNGEIRDKNGLMPLAVTYDMQWLKRGRADNSRTGHGAIMGSQTKNVLDFACANKYCRVCEAAKSKGKQPVSHDFRINHSGSSKSMEASVGVKLFKQAPTHGVKYSVFIGDDDSATIAKIREEVEYSVEKWSDASHATRTIVGHLNKISSERKHQPGESPLSQKVIEYFRKCFSSCLCQNEGDPERLKVTMKAIVPHAFGDHQHCLKHTLKWCDYIKNPEQYHHKDLTNGKDLQGESLKTVLTDLFGVYSSDLVINKLVANASSQINESWHSIVSSKAPKIRFYGGSESSDQRVASAVAQTNSGKQYLLDSLRCLNIEPGNITEKNIVSIEKEGKAEKQRKSSVKFKKERRKNFIKKEARNTSDVNKEEVTYQSGIALTLDPKLLERAIVTKEKLQAEFEKEVPAFTNRLRKQFIIVHAEPSRKSFVIISFDAEITCGGKEAEIIQLAAQTETGQIFSRLILPNKDISFHASRVNKFQTTAIGGKKILHRGGIHLETVSQAECLESFVDFIAASETQNDFAKVILIGHNSSSFDTPVLLRTVLHYSPQLIPKMKELNIHFADSLACIRQLIKEKCEALKTEDGSFVKPNQAAVYRILFKKDFAGHDAVEDVKALNKILFNSSLVAIACEIVNKSQTTTIQSALEQLIYLDHSFALQQSFQGKLCNSSNTGVIKKGLAKKLADSGIGYQHLRQLFDKHGKDGLLSILANPPTSGGSYNRRSVRGTANTVVLQQILNHFQGQML